MLFRSLETAVGRLWAAAIAKQHQRVAEHPLNCRYGAAESWPRYFLAKASVLLRAQEIVAASAPLIDPSVSRAPSNSHCTPAPIREAKFTACNGKLTGRPDVIRPGEVVDYKSGAVHELDETASSDIVKAAYVRQLRIYGYLVKQTLGWWPQRGILLPLVGSGIEVPLHQGECEEGALQAVALLDSYSTKVRSEAQPIHLASPAPHVCKWCPYKLVCSPFWQSVSPSWARQLDGEAIEGTIHAVPRPLYSGEALALTINIQKGTAPSGQAQIAPVNVITHPTAAALAPPDLVRIIGLRARPDGALVPAQRTVIARVEDLPTLSTAPRPSALSAH